MGCCSSKQIDDKDDGPTQPKPATSPETKVSTARPDIRKLESQGGAPGWAETVTTPQTAGSASTQPDEAPKSPHHPSEVEPSAPGGSPLPSTDPDTKAPHASNDGNPQIPHRLEIYKLWDALSPASGKRSKRLHDLDRTGQLKDRTKPRFQGNFSDVSQAKLGDRVVAVKALRLTNIEGDEQSASRMWKRLGREIYVWAALDHPNVLELLGFAFEDEIPCLISPWCENGTVQKYLEKFPNANRRQLVRGIAEGLKYLHEQTPPIIHGDFKTVPFRNKFSKIDNVPQTNVCVTDKHVAKICDFGSSRRVEQRGTGFTTSAGVPTTTRYNAPEILEHGQNPTLRSDVFSFAYVALETMSGKSPFWQILKDVAIVTQVVIKRQMPSPEDHPGLEDATWELLRKCWEFEPSDRPNMVYLALAGYGPTATPDGTT
ncbi:hypothetical protein FRC00_002193 [Tulasnella sp. 408]|nr:hypothetical protein FRC00_002193 [Tulasnella sp. 408]